MNLDYNTRLASIQRNEKLAEIMRQQAFQPIEVQSYQGIQAPISPLSGLAKVLQAYMGARGTGDEERIKLNQEAKAEAQQMLSGLQDRPASPGRAAVMGMPEIQAQPATSFTPMGSDFEDNPNLTVAPSGNVETPAVAYQPAVAPQAAIPPQAAQQLTNEQRNKKLVEIMMSQNPYATPVAKLEYERLGKEGSGPLAEYNLYVQQTRAAGGTPIGIDEYKTKQKIAGRSVTNVSMPTSLAPIFVRNKTTGETLLIQPDNRGNFDLKNYEPVDKGTNLRQTLADAGIFPNLPDGTPNPEFQKYAKSALEKDTTLVLPPSSTTKNPVTGEITQTLPTPEKGMVNVTIDGKATSIPLADFEKLNAKIKGAETRAVEGAKAEYEFESVPDGQGGGGKVLMSKAEIARLQKEGKPVVSVVDAESKRGLNVLDLAARAKAILPKASSGAISSLFTLATDAAGIPTNSSAADAQLKVIGAGLTASVPRMEGPQSNTDLMEYKVAAANVANGNIPIKTRLEALKIVVDLNEKYATSPTARPPGSVRRITPKAGQQ
jgi:hypothetical protein